jgi:hypothetical protein
MDAFIRMLDSMAGYRLSGRAYTNTGEHVTDNVAPKINTWTAEGSRQLHIEAFHTLVILAIRKYKD